MLNMKENTERKTCENPYKKTKCSNQDIELFIIYKGVQLQICGECAKEILDSDIEWGD